MLIQALHVLSQQLCNPVPMQTQDMTEKVLSRHKTIWLRDNLGPVIPLGQELLVNPSTLAGDFYSFHYNWSGRSRRLSSKIFS